MTLGNKQRHDIENKFSELTAHCDRIKCLHIPVELPLTPGMDGEDLSCCMDDLLTICEASVAVSEASAADGELGFGEDSEP